MEFTIFHYRVAEFVTECVYCWREKNRRKILPGNALCIRVFQYIDKLPALVQVHVYTMYCTVYQSKSALECQVPRRRDATTLERRTNIGGGRCAVICIVIIRRLCYLVV